MKKKEYERPTTQVVQLKQRQQLLTGSQDQAGVQNYNWQSEDEE